MFSFFCIFADGAESPIQTDNIFVAQRAARTLGALHLYVRNPGTKMVSKLVF